MEILFDVKKIKPVHSVNAEDDPKTDTTYILKANDSGAAITITLAFKDDIPTQWNRLLGQAGDTVRVLIGAASQQETLDTEEKKQ